MNKFKKVCEKFLEESFNSSEDPTTTIKRVNDLYNTIELELKNCFDSNDKIDLIKKHIDGMESEKEKDILINDYIEDFDKISNDIKDLDKFLTSIKNGINKKYEIYSNAIKEFKK